MNFRTFTDWCLHKESISPAARITVETILSEIYTDNYSCSRANQILSNTTSLFLMFEDSSIAIDLKPLESLNHLTSLYLHADVIIDISPLSALSNLTNLEIWSDRITDLTPLSTLKNLSSLSLHVEEHPDLSPLESLKKFKSLNLDYNRNVNFSSSPCLPNITSLSLRTYKSERHQLIALSHLSSLINLNILEISGYEINDLSPLCTLSNLTNLHLEENNISDLTPLKNIPTIKIIILNNNQLADASPLKTLNDLTFLKLDDNPIKDITPLQSLIGVAIQVQNNQYTEIGFEQWIRSIFDYQTNDTLLDWEDQPGEWHQLIKLPPSLEVEYITQACENAAEVFKVFSDTQLDRGFWKHFSLSRLSDESVSSLSRRRGIDSIFVLFKDLFAKKCSPHLCHLDESYEALNGTCYMWWDIKGGFNEETINVMQKILYLDSDACCESALHGLGHAAIYYPDKVAAIIDQFIANKNNIRLELKEYAQAARIGDVQ